ncbi:hypothetical protein SRHO_G00060860 [Serrasalmus rhombeus]
MSAVHRWFLLPRNCRSTARKDGAADRVAVLSADNVRRSAGISACWSSLARQVRGLETVARVQDVYKNGGN